MDLPLSGHFDVGQFGASVMATSSCARVHAKPRSSTVRRVHLAPFFASGLSVKPQAKRCCFQLGRGETGCRIGSAPAPMRRSSACGRDTRRNAAHCHRWQTGSRTPSRLAEPEGHRPRTGHRCRVLPTCDREGESEASPLGWHCGRAAEDGFVHSPGHLSARTRTTWRGVTLSERRSRARCQRAEGTTPGASTRNPMEGRLIIPRGSPIPGRRPTCPHQRNPRHCSLGFRCLSSRSRTG